MKKPFLTEYRAEGGGRYGALIWAVNRADAIQKARRRGLREKVLGEKGGLNALDTPIWETLADRRKSPQERFHALCFFTLLALKSKAATVEALFDDSRGLIHEWMHVECFGNRGGDYRSKEEMLKAFKRMATNIPGYCRRGLAE